MSESSRNRFRPVPRPDASGDGFLAGMPDFEGLEPRLMLNAISGSIWHDTNLDGAWLGLESAVPGMSVYIDTDGDGQRGSDEPQSVSAADGSWTITGLDAGEYDVVADLSGSMSVTTPDAGHVVLGADETVADLEIGLHIPDPYMVVWLFNDEYSQHLEFADVTVGRSANNQVWISNIGLADLKVNLADVSSSFGFFVIGDTDPDGGWTIAHGRQLRSFMSFWPDTRGLYEGVLTLQTNEPGRSPFEISLSGMARGAEVRVTYKGVELIDGEGDPIPLGTVAPHISTQAVTLEVHNDGDEPLRLYASYDSDDEGFSVDVPLDSYVSSWKEVAPGDSCDVTISFVGSAPGEYSGLVGFSTNVYGVGSFMVPVSATVRPAVDGELSLVDVLVDNTGAWDGLAGANAHAMSPDGEYMYVAGSDLGVFTRDPVTGTVEMLQVLERGGDFIEVSPDGKHVYLSYMYSDDVSIFERDAATGLLSFVDRFDIDGGTRGLAISPDGAFVYIGRAYKKGLKVCSRDAITGLLTQVQYLSGVNTDIALIMNVKLSPDGDFAYVAVNNPAAIVVYARDAVDGQLTKVATIADAGSWGDTPPRYFTFSPDGHHAYLSVSGDPQQIEVFARDEQTGDFTWVSALTLDQLGVADQMMSIRRCEISPDGNTVYLIDTVGDAVGVFARDGEQGLLQLVQVVSGGSEGFETIDTPAKVRISADGSFAYILGYPGTLSVFARDTATGALTTEVQYAEQDLGGINGFDNAKDVAVSPDGRNLYVAGGFEKGIGVFSIDEATGTSEFVQTLRLEGWQGDGWPLYDVTVSPDGAFVYGLLRYNSSNYDNDVVILSRDPATGELTHIKTISQFETGDFERTSDLIVSPDGEYLYAYGDLLTVFRRDVVTGDVELLQVDDGAEPLRAYDLSVSADGEYLYVASPGQVTVYRHNADDGFLESVQTLIDQAEGPVTLEYPMGVEVSADGACVFVSSCSNNSIAVFARDAQTGLLTFVNEFAGDGDDGTLDDPLSIVLTPDTRRVMVFSKYGDHPVSVFAYDPQTGGLALMAQYDCHAAGLEGSDVLEGILLSPDGGHLYVVKSDNVMDSDRPGSVSVFSVSEVSAEAEISVWAETGEVVSGQSSPIDFGSPLQYRPAPMVEFTVRNDGSQPLTLDGLQVPAGFSLVDAMPSSVAPADTATLTLRMDTSVVAQYGGDVVFTTNDDNETTFVIPVVGQVRWAPATIAVEEPGVSGVPVNGLDFGFVAIGDDASALLTIRNDGAEDLVLSDMTVGSGDISIAVLPSPGAGPIVLAPMEEAIVELTFAPVDAGDFADTLRIFSDDPSYGVYEIDLAGVAALLELSAACDGETLEAGQVEPIDFGVNPPGISLDTKVVRISNNCEYPIVVSEVLVTGEFAVSASVPRELSPGGFVDINIESLRTGLGASAGTLTMTSSTAGVAPLTFQLAAVRAGGIPGDYNGDGQLTVADIDCLGQAIRGGVFLSEYDFNSDGSVDGADLYALVTERFGCLPGDADLDGDVDRGDFSIMKQNFGRNDAGWADGDFNADGKIDLEDFVSIRRNYGQTVNISYTNLAQVDLQAQATQAVTAEVSPEKVLLGSASTSPSPIPLRQPLSRRPQTVVTLPASAVEQVGLTSPSRSSYTPSLTPEGAGMFGLGENMIRLV